MCDAYEELEGFLFHKNQSVKFASTNTVLSLSEDADFIQYLGDRGSGILRGLLRNMECDDSNELALTAISALLNLSGHPKVSYSIVKLGGICRVYDSYVSRSIYPQMHCSLLANLTRESVGARCALQVPKLLAVLFSQYCSIIEESIDSIGLILLNLSTTENARSLLVSLGEGKIFALLSPVMLTCRRRRVIVLRIFRNFFLDNNIHHFLANSRVILDMLKFLYPESNERRKDQVPVEVLEGSVGLAADFESRFIASEILFAFTRTVSGREHMRKIGVYEVLRMWLVEEFNEEIQENIAEVANLVHLSEREILNGRLDMNSTIADSAESENGSNLNSSI